MRREFGLEGWVYGHVVHTQRKTTLKPSSTAQHWPIRFSQTHTPDSNLWYVNTFGDKSCPTQETMQTCVNVAGTLDIWLHDIHPFSINGEITSGFNVRARTSQNVKFPRDHLPRDLEPSLQVMNCTPQFHVAPLTATINFNSSALL